MNASGFTAGRPTRSYWLALLAIVAIAAALRLWYVLRVSPELVNISDPWAYYLLGKNLAEGRGYIRPADFHFYRRVIPTAEFAPLFPSLLAGLHLLGASTQELQKVIVAPLGVAIVPLVAEIARRVRGTAAGIVAAVLAALSPTLVEADGAFMTEAPCLLLVAASLLTALSARGQPLRWALAGSLVGLAGLCRAEALLLVPLWAPVVLWLEFPAGRGRALGLAGALIAGAALTVLPWTVRNGAVLGAFVPVSSSGSSALLGANCPETYAGPLMGSWAFNCFKRLDIEGMSEADRFAHYRETGLAFARRHADLLPQVMAARLRRTFGLYEPAIILASEGRNPAWSRPAMRVGVVVLAVALCGAALLTRRSPPLVALLGAPLILVCITSLLVYGNPRFRLIAEPALVVLAAIAVVEVVALAAAYRHRNREAASGV